MAVKNSDRSSERLGIKLAVVIGCKIALITVIFFLFFGRKRRRTKVLKLSAQGFLTLLLLLIPFKDKNNDLN